MIKIRLNIHLMPQHDSAYVAAIRTPSREGSDPTDGNARGIAHHKRAPKHDMSRNFIQHTSYKYKYTLYGVTANAPPTLRHTGGSNAARTLHLTDDWLRGRRRRSADAAFCYVRRRRGR